MGETDCFRVKFLDQQDIEECGWELLANPIIKSENQKVFLMIGKDNRNKSGESTYTLLAGYNQWCVIYNGEHSRFAGYIKNKSELLRLMKMLDII